MKDIVTGYVKFVANWEIFSLINLKSVIQEIESE